MGEASNGMDALKQVREKKADVMLLDMIMPALDGFGVLTQLQRLSADQRPYVIAVTALGRDDFIRRAVDLGAVYYMIKPIDLPVLLDRIREVARGGLPDSAPAPSLSGQALSLDDRLSNLFLGMGIPAHIKGYQYLREAIKLVIETPDMIGGITKENMGELKGRGIKGVALVSAIFAAEDITKECGELKKLVKELV